MSGYRIEANKLRTTKILNVKKENQTVKTFTFEDEECAKAKPGQFLMLWIPGIDEIPLSILDSNRDGKVSVVVKNVGEATKAMHKKMPGDVVGVRGPFGNSFTVKEGRVLMVGGGTGIAPLFFMARRIVPAKTRSVLVLGAKTRDELLLVDELNTILGKEEGQIITTTEDGSCGITGLCTEPLERLLNEGGFTMIYACGPEKMIRRVFELAEHHGIDMEASLERLMRCAIGLCGSCIIGKYRVCKDGPVFASKQLKQIQGELGVSKLDFDGKRIPL